MARAWVVPFTVGFAVIIAAAGAAIWWVSDFEEASAVRRGAAEALARSHDVGAMLLDLGAATRIGISDTLASEIARATGTEVILMDSAAVGDPRIFGSTLGRGPEVVDLARRQRVEWSSTGQIDEVTVEGVAYFVDAAILAVPVGPSIGIVALERSTPATSRPNLVHAAMIGAGAGAVVLAFLLIWLVGRRLGGPLGDIVTAARRAARGDQTAGVTIPSSGPMAELGVAIQSLIERARKRPSIPDTDLARVSSTQMRMPALTAEPETIDGANLAIGQVFADRYEILQKLGHSDVRTAYKVRDRELGELVLLKTLNQDLFHGDPNAVERFKADLRVARRLAHRNILRTYDFGESQGVYFVTMELVDAIPLRELLQSRGRLNVASTIAMISQASRALAIAHRDGVLHRDVRPRSLLLDQEGVLKVSDFGLASPAHRTRALAETATSAGAFAYVAPEVLQAGRVDHRADLYSLGVVTYECLAGHPPFTAESPQEQLQLQLHQQPTPLSEINPQVPQEFSDLVNRTLAPNPEGRPETADQLRELLSHISYTPA